MEVVRVWEEEVVIPTYEVGAADKNPMFLEKRVYQGSSGKVYPYPATEKISRVKSNKTYQAVYLENEFLKVMILPELGGRIQRAYDKTNDYDFVYYNHVIKPALVGLTGPWISGGIEFNWPQHHRPTTFMKVDHILKEHEDGSKSVYVNDVDQMYGTKGIAGFTLYPGRAYIEISGQLYNRTPLPQTFLWWANPAVAANGDTQSIFPPDVHSVYDHGKRDVSRFPMASGTYYKHDYSEGVDISRYKNIPVPTSYMAEKSEYDFVGGYDYKKRAGILHVADHHISPGKKQWTWGCGEFGKAWDKSLTDEDGPYVELMTGVYTDNQPDFTWLKPFEEKTFRQYFMPYKGVGQVKNASIHAVLNTKITVEGLYVSVYGTGIYDQAEIVVIYEGEEVYKECADLSPTNVFEKVLPVKIVDETRAMIQIRHQGNILVAYQAKPEGIPKLAEPAKAARVPSEIMTNEELYLTGQHIEQYRHATYLPDAYYLEGLKRDAGDIRINNAYGQLLFRRGDFKAAKHHYEAAISRLTYMNPNPYDSEAYYNLGLVLFYQEQFEKAYDAFFKATWSNEQQEMSFYYLAVIQARNEKWKEAQEFIDKALVKNAHNIKARGLKAVLLRKTGNVEGAMEQTRKNLEVDPFDYVSLFEYALLAKENWTRLCMRMNLSVREGSENYLQTARDYAESGFYEEAIAVLDACNQEAPLLHYYKGFYYGKRKEGTRQAAEYAAADRCSPVYCFPNKLEDAVVLCDAAKQYGKGAKASYYLGNLNYDKRQFEKAIAWWEVSKKLDGNYPTLLRNLSIAYYNKQDNPQKAAEQLEKAFSLDVTDARVFLELDQLHKKMGMTAGERLHNYKLHLDLITQRDDLYIEYVTLLNLLEQHQEAYDAIMAYEFRPWEGAEGKITTQYKTALWELSKKCISKKEYKEAKPLVKMALQYPANLGEGRLEGTKDNHLYFTLGCIFEKLEEKEQAERCYRLADCGNGEPAGMMYYYDQPADMILYQGWAKLKLGDARGANARFYSLIDYGERHMYDRVQIDYFAVSLPDFLIFEEDLDKKNQAHCYYLIGLGKLGLGKEAEAAEQFEHTLKLDSNHQNAMHYRRECEDGEN